MTASRMQVAASRRYGTASPLRYPGGKAALAGLFADLIASLGLDRPTYVEPYAGGAGAGIALLLEGHLSSVVINDIDPAVHAFWKSVVERNADLVDWVRDVPLTLSEWERQRGVYRSCTDNAFDLGRAFFYLNRTNRSGVLNAGVIGGKSQQGKYKIDARFNRATLAARLEAIGAVSDAVEVTDLDGRTVIKRFGSRKSTFMYIDPPYVQAGSQLYLNAFDGRDHAALASVVEGITKADWIITYDLDPFVERLYGGHFQALLDLNYSARYPGRAQELIVAPNRVADALKELDAVAAGA
ncbi:MAG: DNA adenine methylase [Dermatophilaceae bacterium]